MDNKTLKRLITDRLDHTLDLLNSEQTTSLPTRTPVTTSLPSRTDAHVQNDLVNTLDDATLAKLDAIAPTDDSHLQPGSERVHIQKRQFKAFYMGVKPNGIKAFRRDAKKTMTASTPSRTDPQTPQSSILTPLETRVDLVLFRSGLVLTRAQARRLINQGHVTLIQHATGQRICMKTPARPLKPLDILELGKGWTTTIRDTVIQRWGDERMTAPIPSYLEVDFSTGRVCLQSYPLDGEVMRPMGMTIARAAMKDYFKK